MQRDPQYGLVITYDECMSTYYRAPSVDDLRTVPDSHYGPLDYADIQTATDEYAWGGPSLQHWDGPWNFTGTAMYAGTRDGRYPKADEKRLAYHHLPFPLLSSMSYTVNDVCRVPYYDGYENHPQYSNAASLDDLLRYPIDRAVANNEGNHVGYGRYVLTNIDLNVSAQATAYDFPSATKNVFKFTAGTEFVSQCGGNFTSTFQSRVDVNGTFVFPFALSLIHI